MCEKNRWDKKFIVYLNNSAMKVARFLMAWSCKGGLGHGHMTDKNASFVWLYIFFPLSLISLTDVRQEISVEAFQLLFGSSLSYHLSDINAYSF